jgi:hypothetical protein
MRWITRESDFREVLSKARDCIGLDHEKIAPDRVRLLFDSSELSTTAFVVLLEQLTIWSEDPVAYYLVIDPDPIKYFRKHFNKYPLVEVSPNDSPRDLLLALKEDPGESPADAIGINWSEFVILPPSTAWFVRGLRDDVTDEGGHLWVPKEWAKRVTAAYQWAREG